MIVLYVPVIVMCLYEGHFTGHGSYIVYVYGVEVEVGWFTGFGRRAAPVMTPVIY